MHIQQSDAALRWVWLRNAEKIGRHPELRIGSCLSFNSYKLTSKSPNLRSSKQQQVVSGWKGWGAPGGSVMVARQDQPRDVSAALQIKEAMKAVPATRIGVGIGQVAWSRHPMAAHGTNGTHVLA